MNQSYCFAGRVAPRSSGGSLRMLLHTGVALCLLFGALSGMAQASLRTTDPYRAFYDARQWFQEGNYAIAYPVFRDMEQQIRAGTIQERRLQLDEVQFYAIACNLMQGNPVAEKDARAFLNGKNNPAHIAQLAWYTGVYYFRKKDYPAAADAFAKIESNTLTPDQKAEMEFSYGYSLLTMRRFKEAKAMFGSARLYTASPRYLDANYYYGLLAYNDGQYQEAIRSFEIAANAPAYRGLAPYYTASIQYALGNKDKGMELAQKALEQGNQYYENELHQLIGHGYFEKGDFGKAIPYLEKYVNRAEKVKREDLYELAFSFYQQKQYEKSVQLFKPLSDGKDSLSQHAMYLLGDAYLKTNDKANAKTAFRYCAANSSNPVIRENSLFNEGKLSHDLGLDDEAAQILKRFLADYPGSRLAPEARELLIAALANTSNYKEALTMYEALNVRTEASQRILPGLLFNRAQEELNDRRIDEAEKLLSRAENAPFNTGVLPLVYFWKGEIAYGRGDYPAALQYMSRYLRNPAEAGEANVFNARYSLGYSMLLTGDYPAAEKEFEALGKMKAPGAQQAEDISMRLADAWFMQKQFAKAKTLYTAASEKRGDFADYALYQLGIIAGAESKPAQKISYLQMVERQYPNSVLAPAACLEIARTYLSDEKYKDALPWLDKVVQARGGDTYKPEALLKQGLAHYNIGNNDAALNSFRALINNFGESAEAAEAVDNVRSIFVEQGKPNEFVVFMKSVGLNLDRNTADSLSYAAAELQLSEGRKEQALNGFTGYLKDFPQGRYSIPAHWFAAELYREKKDMSRAFPLYENLVKNAPNKYAENATLQVARYLYFEQKNYKEALVYYEKLADNASNQENKLEAMRGIVRCQYYSGSYSAATVHAEALLKQRGIGTDDKIFANLVLGKNAAGQGNCNAAMVYYREVAAISKAETGAEARYGIAECLLQAGKLEEAENAGFDVIKKSGSYAFWVTKAYILLGDVYHRQKDYFNARATFKSVAENAADANLKKEAAAKLAQVEKEEKEQSKIEQ